MAEAVDTIVVDPSLSSIEGSEQEKRLSPSEALVGWVMGHVTEWRSVRDSTYKDRWDTWYNTWRGRWTGNSKQRKSQRSKLISPASQMAVDLTVAEIVEAIFGRESWFDIPDNISDEEKADAIAARDQLREDLFKSGIIKTMIEIALNGALYGTGIAKINIDVEMRARPAVVPSFDADGNANGQKAIKREEEVVSIFPTPVEPGQLIVDPSSNEIDQMLGAAHEFRMPLHKIGKRQREGTYRNVPVGFGTFEWGTDQRKEEVNQASNEQWALITEWHGLVPRALLLLSENEGDDVVGQLVAGMNPMEMVEAIITIANETTMLRAIPNPSLMDDRGLLSYQHDNVPNRFWGRGVMEKAEHSQKALDTEMRSRADNLAWVSNPMMAGNLTKLPPRMNLNAWPGKFWGTRGDPREVLQEFRFGDVNASTFQQAEHLERLVQDATGARDPATMRQGVRDESAGAAGIAVSGMIKRSRRTMYNIEEFLGNLIRRILWRKMQFEPERYPQDFDFQVKGTLGVMAREIEQSNMINLLQFTEQGTPPYLLILKSIFENSSSTAKGQLARAIDEMMKPPSEEEVAKAQALEELQRQAQVEEVRNKRADTAVKLANAGLAGAKEVLTNIEAELKEDQQVLENIRVLIDQEEVQNQREQLSISREALDIDRQRVANQSRSNS